MTSFLQNRQLTIALTGEIDHHSTREIMRELGKKIDLYLPGFCVLDFRDVTFMDSSGIAIVIHTIRRMQEIVRSVHLDRALVAYASRLVAVTREPAQQLVRAGQEEHGHHLEPVRRLDREFLH